VLSSSIFQSEHVSTEGISFEKTQEKPTPARVFAGGANPVVLLPACAKKHLAGECNN